MSPKPVVYESYFNVSLTSVLTQRNQSLYPAKTEISTGGFGKQKLILK